MYMVEISIFGRIYLDRLTYDNSTRIVIRDIETTYTDNHVKLVYRLYRIR